MNAGHGIGLDQPAGLDLAAVDVLRQRCGRRSPDGKVQADVKIKGKDVAGSWGKRGYEYTDDADTANMDQSDATITLLLVLDGKPGVSDTVALQAESGRINGDVRPCWSPDSRWLAWVLHRDPPMLRTPAENEIRLEQLTRPRIQLVAHKDVRAQAMARVTPALEKAGYRVANSKDSSQGEQRSATILYAAPGYEDTAKALAAVIPGGATVAKMDWKAAFDIVVGIGQSALVAR